MWDLTCVGGELGWYVSNFCVYAGCCSDQYAPPRALPNVRECGTVRTDTVVYVPTPGQTPGLAEKKEALKGPGMAFDTWLNLRHIALRPLLWEVCCDVYTRFKSSYEAAKGDKIWFGVRRFELD